MSTPDKPKRVPGDVLRESRKRDSAAKRGAVMAALEEMKADGSPITAPKVAARAGVSVYLVYQPGVREHIEAAAAAGERAARRGAVAGTRASAASLATDLELAKAQIKALREERDRLKAAVRTDLGTQLKSAGTRELTERINELLAQNAALATDNAALTAKLDAALAGAQQLAAQLREAEDDLTAARALNKDLMKKVNRPG